MVVVTDLGPPEDGIKATQVGPCTLDPLKMGLGPSADVVKATGGTFDPLMIELNQHGR